MCAANQPCFYPNHQTKARRKFFIPKNGGVPLAHAVGIDTGEVLVVRGGVRNDNDLIWIGRAPNIAAKLSSLRESPYYSFITDDVYNMLSKESKFASDGRSIWEQRNWKGMTIYRSSWYWAP